MHFHPLNRSLGAVISTTLVVHISSHLLAACGLFAVVECLEHAGVGAGLW